MNKGNFYNHEIEEEERTFYSKRTVDIEYKYPFGQEELWAVAYRTNYDLDSHQKGSKMDLTYFDGHERYLPHVIEPTFGVNQTLLAILSEAYTEEKERTVLKIKPNTAPYKTAVFPLLKNKPDLVKKAREIFDLVKTDFVSDFDDNRNIGKRYRRQDEIGTPYCITVDFDSLEKNDVTIRDRDTMKQERIKIEKVINYLKNKLS